MRARAFFICLVGLLFLFPANVSAVTSLSWDPGSITKTLMVGESATFSVSFKSSISLENPEFFITPVLQPFITTSGLKSISANKWYKIKLTLTAPPEAMFGPYFGTIHLRDALNTLPDTLKINLVVLRPAGVLDFVLDYTSKVSSNIISKDGGTLETSSGGIRYTLTFPPFALSEDVEVTMTAISSITGLPMGGDVIPAVQLGPQGLILLKPATLTVELPDPCPANLMGFIFRDNGDGFHLHPIEISGNMVTFDLMHFSGTGLILEDRFFSATCEELKTLIPSIIEFTYGGTAEERAMNRIALVKEFLKRCDYDFEAQDIAQDLNRDTFYDWFFGTPGIDYTLQLAEGDPLKIMVAVNALNTWYLTLADVQPMVEDGFEFPVYCGATDGTLCEYLDEIIDAISPRVNNMFKNTIIDANKRCLDSSGQPPDAEALELLGLAFEQESSGIPFYQDVDLYGLFDLKTCGICSREIDPLSLELKIGESDTLKIVAKDINGNEIEGYDNYSGWVSDNASVALVYSNGEVRAVGEGTTNIRSTFVTPRGRYVEGLWCQPAEITVKHKYKVEIIPDVATIKVGDPDPLELDVHVTDEDGMLIEDPDIEWSWTVPVGGAVIYFDEDNQLVTGVKEGTVTITATYEGESGSAKITVGTQVCSSVEIKPSTANILVDESKTLEVTVIDQDGNIIPDPDLVWTIPIGGIISFDPTSQVVKGVTEGGPVELNATCDGVSGTSTINVVTPNAWRMTWKATSDAEGACDVYHQGCLQTREKISQGTWEGELLLDSDFYIISGHQSINLYRYYHFLGSWNCDPYCGPYNIEHVATYNTIDNSIGVEGFGFPDLTNRIQLNEVVIDGKTYIEDPFYAPSITGNINKVHTEHHWGNSFQDAPDGSTQCLPADYTYDPDEYEGREIISEIMGSAYYDLIYYRVFGEGAYGMWKWFFIYPGDIEQVDNNTYEKHVSFDYGGLVIDYWQSLAEEECDPGVYDVAWLNNWLKYGQFPTREEIDATWDIPRKYPINYTWDFVIEKVFIDPDAP